MRQCFNGFVRLASLEWPQLPQLIVAAMHDRLLQPVQTLTVDYQQRLEENNS